MNILCALDEKFYKRDGFIIIERAIGADAILTINNLLDQHLSSSGFSDNGAPVLAAQGMLKTDPAIQSSMGLLGLPSSNELDEQFGMKIGDDQVVSKAPNREFSPPWHQDHAMFRRRSKLTLYLALTSNDAPALEVIPGSQELGALNHSNGTLDASEDISWTKAVSLRMDSGTIALINPCLVHRGLPNQDDVEMRSYSIMFESC